jgi:two-component system CheB/CheR fusion protein
VLKEKQFPIVAIGASLGGLDAISTILQNLPANTGMAYIYVQHLSPDHKSLLTTILSKITKMKVQEIENMEFIEPNNIYVIPHNRIIKVIDVHIQLLERPKNSSAISIDVLFSSLAETHKKDVIGIVLSGNATDGTYGLKKIKEFGGITIAQDNTAQAESMPQSAIDSGYVDFVLSPEEIALKLVKLSLLPLKNIVIKPRKVVTIEDNNQELKLIFELLLKETGVDFSHYKMATIKRRLNHKMLQCGVKNLKAYLGILQAKNNEIDILYNDLLINVTSFFRDNDVFKYLKSALFPKLLAGKSEDEVLRIWVPACSTGEEAYSIAILLSELLVKQTLKIPIQIFATDLSEHAIREARLGEYSINELTPLSKKQIDLHFIKKGDIYKISKELRDMCIFAPHNILKDPPFSRMDFISCCNILIYFDSEAQKKVFNSLHFALNEDGYLMLGKAESVGTTSPLFSRINNTFKIYSRKNIVGFRKILELSPRFPSTNMYNKKIANSVKNITSNRSGIKVAIDEALLNSFMPACVVVNKEMEIMEFRGPVSSFLEHPSGKASLNILKMIKPELAFELRNAIHESSKTNLIVKKSGIEIENTVISFEVCPLKMEFEESLMLVVFSMKEQVEKIIEYENDGKTLNSKGSVQKDKMIKKLTDELNNARAEMNAIIEAQEITYEELQAANEEIVSTNEEFQTLNEELETSKEEIEATNEELIASNQEIQIRNDLLTKSYEFSEAIIATIHEPMLVLNKDFYVKSANKSFYEKFKVNKEETEGRYLFELGGKQWNLPKLRDLLKNIINQNLSFENFEVNDTFPTIGEKTMLLNAQLIVQKNNSEKIILLAFKDITERFKYHNKEKELLNKEKELAEEAVRAKQQFLSNMSHEIRTPMNAIIGFTKVVLKTNLTVKQKEYLDAIKLSGDALIVLINDILDLAKVDSGKMTFENTVFNLKASVCAMTHLFETKIQEKNLLLIKEFDELIPQFLIGDSVRLNQIILNLLSNAIKFTSEGYIKVSIKLIKDLKEEVQIEFAIEDTGIGIEKSKLAYIFESFQQASSDTSRLYGGTGLGLAIVKQLVELQGVKVSVESKTGKGSRFSFVLNFVKTNEEFQPKEINQQLESSINNIKVLVVEDIALNQLLMKTILDDYGFERDIAENGKIAIEKLNQKSYDIILMDLQMPEMNGFEATDYIRNTLNSKIPIIALTADVTTVDVAKCKAIGMNDYIAKPVDEKLLFNKIISLVKKTE